MIVEKCLVNIVFPIESDLRAKFFIVEQSLKGIFRTPFNLVSLPDGAPPEIPRIIANSEHGHATLSITLQNAQIEAKFDANYQHDIDKCFSYAREKIEAVIKAMIPAIGSRILFFGVSTVIRCDETDDPVNTLKQNLFLPMAEGKPYDLSAKITYTRDDTFYINIELHNERKFAGLTTGIFSVSERKQIAHSVIATVDVNDRFAFNNDASHSNSKENRDRTFEISKDFILNKLGSMIFGKEHR